VYTEKKVKKSGKVKDDDFKFDIKNVPFSRKLSFLSFSEGLAATESGSERKQIQLNRMLRKYEAVEGPQSPGLMSIRPMFENRSIPYVCVATPSMLELDTEYGYVQFCFDNKDLTRIRGKGIGLRLFSRMKPHEACISRLDGTYQISYDTVGEFLFVPVAGELEFDSDWQWKRVGSEDVTIDVSPDSSGEFEIAIHYAESNTERDLSYRPFEDCVEEAQKDYEDWLSMYPRVPGKYEDVKKLSAYSIWICYVAPMGILKGNIVLFAKNNSAFSWHQAYHAMAIENNVDLSVQIMRNMFDYQDEFGEIPDLVDDQYINILATKPPFHGFALLYMLDRMGDRLTAEHCRILYEPLAKWYRWWMTLRDTDHDGIPQYNQGCESGIDFSMMLSKGTPVECPDLISYMILLGEGLGKLAEKLGKYEEAKEWAGKSQNMLEVLLRDFWDGEKFIARVSSSHEIVDFDEIEAYVPLMLGKRLPREVVDKLAETLSDPEKYYTHIGFRSAPKQYRDGMPMPGFVGGFAQIKLIPGLYEAGKKELARDVLTGFCDSNLEKVPNFGYLEFDPPGQKGDGFGSFGKCSALSSAIFIVMAGYLAEISK
jgi:putative isomerase